MGNANLVASYVTEVAAAVERRVVPHVLGQALSACVVGELENRGVIGRGCTVDGVHPFRGGVTRRLVADRVGMEGSPGDDDQEVAVHATRHAGSDQSTVVRVGDVARAR